VNTSIGRYVLGVAALAVVCGSLAFAALAIRRRVLPDWTGAPARLGEVVIGLALLVGILELLGAVRLFAFAPVVIASALVGLAAARWLAPPRSRGWVSPGIRPRRRRAWSSPHEPDSARSTSVGPRGPVRSGSALPRAGGIDPTAVLAGALALAAGATVVAEWGALTIQSYDVGIRGFDSLWYHLPWAASFAQTGNAVSLRFTDVEYLTPFYPATTELLHGLGIVLLGRDTLSPGLNLVWLGLVLLAAYCIGRPRGVGGATMLGAALAMATTMMDYSQAGSAANDVVAIFFVLAAVALLAGAPDPGPRTPVLVLAAIAAGLAAGVKLTVLAPVLGLTIGVVAIAPRARRLAIAGAWLGPLLLAGGFWYARNLVAVGNPLPWTSLGFLPTPAPPLQQHTGYSVAHYLASTHVWSRFFEPALASGLGRWWYLILAAAVIGPLLCLLPDRLGRNPEIVGVSSQAPVRMLGLVALFSLAAYLVTPETAAGPPSDPVGFGFNLRYLAPALTLSLAVLPLAPVLASRARSATAGGLAILLAGTVAQARLWPAHVAGAVALAAAALVIGVALVALARVARPRLALALAAVLAVVLAVAAAGAGYPFQRHYLRGRYAYHPGVSYLAPVWAMFRTIHHARVGVVGTFGGFFSYPLYGVDDSNRVQYVARRGPHGSFTAIATCARWRAQVNNDHLDYLITTPARDPWHPRILSPSPESGWTASDPAARPVFRELALGQPIVVYRIQGLLTPARCR
jgi:hypothetical protein